MEKSKDMIYFLESCKSEATRKSYEFHIEKFLEWSGKDFESIKFLSKSEVTDLLCDYALYKKKRVSPNSLLPYFGGIFKLFKIADIDFNRTKVVGIFGSKVSLRGYRPITDQELNDMIQACWSDLERALIHVLSATGHRPDAFTDLKMRDLIDVGDGCLCLRIYIGSRNHEAEIFLHKFASDFVRKYHEWRESNGEKLTSDSWVFIGGRKFATMPIRPMTSSTITKTMIRIMKRAKITREKHGTNRYDIAPCGSFRKRFDTILKGNPNIPRASAERLMDHKDGLESNYYKPTREHLFQDYKKAIPELIFDKAEKLKVVVENKQKKIDELQSSKVRISELESRMDTINKHLQELKKED